MVTVAPDSAASMHGPNPASYWRSSSWADNGPVKATLETFVPSIRVTDTSAAPGIVCLASSATRPRISDSCCSLSMILLSSAKAARGSSGGSAPPAWGVDMVAPAGGVGLRGRASRPSSKSAPSAAHERKAGTRTGGPLSRVRRRPVVGSGANSPHAWDRHVGNDATRRSSPPGPSRRGRGPPERGDGGVGRYASGRDTLVHEPDVLATLQRAVTEA